MTTASTIGQKLWNYCDVLRDAGLSYGDYLEQLTYLIFLKMMYERSQPLYASLPDYQPPPIPSGYDWSSLLALDGDELETHYRRTLETLARQPGTLGVIFAKAQNKIQEPAMLTRLIRDLINSENWTALSADVKGDAYESLLERNAQDVKTGAGQYFTPRPVIQAVVDVMRPAPDTTICDPACGTGGFLLAAHDYIMCHNTSLDRGQKEHLQRQALHGWEIVDSAARLGAMNLYLHGIGGDETNIVRDDSLRAHPGRNYDMVLTNPPFGRKSSLTFINAAGKSERESLEVERPDFWATTSNKQLNFLQHVHTLLKIHGRAAVVVPDNVPVRGRRGGDSAASAASRVRGAYPTAAAHRHVLFPGRQGQRALLRPSARPRDPLDPRPLDLRPPHQSALHPQGQSAGPLPPRRLRRVLQPRTTVTSARRPKHFHRFSYDDLLQRDKVNLDIFWLRDESMADSASLPPPDLIAEEIVEDLPHGPGAAGRDSRRSLTGMTSTVRRRDGRPLPRPPA